MKRTPIRFDDSLVHEVFAALRARDAVELALLSAICYDPPRGLIAARRAGIGDGDFEAPERQAVYLSIETLHQLRRLRSGVMKSRWRLCVLVRHALRHKVLPEVTTEWRDDDWGTAHPPAIRWENLANGRIWSPSILAMLFDARLPFEVDHLAARLHRINALLNESIRHGLAQRQALLECRDEAALKDYMRPAPMRVAV